MASEPSDVAMNEAMDRVSKVAIDLMEYAHQLYGCGIGLAESIERSHEDLRKIVGDYRPKLADHSTPEAPDAVR